MLKKTINRNAFNEKLIHRYYFETLYLDRDKRKELLPEFLKKKVTKLNLIVPEDTKYDKNYRADFTLYFKDDEEGYPVEIKWHSEELNKKNQLDYLNEHKGFLVSFDNPKNLTIPHVAIDNIHFKRWLVKKVDILWDDSISSKVIQKTGEKTWIVVLRGQGALENFHKMKIECKNKTNFWAFKNEKYAVENLLNLEIGDEMLFLFVKSVHPEGSALIPDSENKLELLEIYFTKIELPYYMVLEGNRSTFFEQRDDLPINKRIWPHFFDFKITDSYIPTVNKYLERKKFSKELRHKIADSSNRGGILMPISSVDAMDLKGQIRLLEKGL